MLEIDNQRLYIENDQLKQVQKSPLQNLLDSLQRSNSTNPTLFESKIQSLERDIQDYKQRTNQQVNE